MNKEEGRPIEAKGHPVEEKDRPITGRGLLILVTTLFFALLIGLAVIAYRVFFWQRLRLDSPIGGVTWTLGPSEYFVLGDNAAISADSRTWPSGPSVDAKLLIGKPLGVR